MSYIPLMLACGGAPVQFCSQTYDWFGLQSQKYAENRVKMDQKWQQNGNCHGKVAIIGQYDIFPSAPTIC